jgi:hypothetical protein
MRSANTQRAGQLHRLFTRVAGVDVRSLYQFWNTPVDGKKTLRDLMVADKHRRKGGGIGTAQTAASSPARSRD